VKISGHRGELSDRHIQRYGKTVGIVFVLTLLTFGASRYVEMPFASFAALAFLLILTKLSHFHWERWFLGKDAAARVAEALEAFSNEYVVLTDLVLPDSKGSIDKLLVGPNGLFVIETKKYSGFVTCDEDRWFLNGQPLRSLSKEVKRNSLRGARNPDSLRYSVAGVRGLSNQAQAIQADPSGLKAKRIRRVYPGLPTQADHHSIRTALHRIPSPVSPTRF
jgi:hypothetical protein